MDWPAVDWQVSGVRVWNVYTRAYNGGVKHELMLDDFLLGIINSDLAS